ncbi:MAG: hypothetical protein AAGD06_15980 [Acidobacteriota bacterium]
MTPRTLCSYRAFTANISVHGVLSALVLLASIAAPAAGQGAIAPDDLEIVPPRAQQRSIPWNDLLSNDGPVGDETLLEYTLPQHGTLTFQAGNFIFTPAPSFWTFGGDRFSYTSYSSSSEGTKSQTATVFLAAGANGPWLLEETFESGFGQLDATGATGLVISSNFVIRGAHSLEAIAGGGATYLSGFLGAGNGDDGGGIEIKIHDPYCCGGTVIGSEIRTTVLALGSPLTPSLAVVLVQATDGSRHFLTEIRDRFGVVHTTAPVPQTTTPATVAVDWWKPRGADLGGLRMRLDGIFGDELRGIDNGDFTTDLIHVGRVDVLGGPGPHLIFDDVRFRYGPIVAEGQVLRLEDFEDGSLAPWANSAATAATTGSPAAFDGAHGLEVETHAPGDAYVKDIHPTAVGNLRIAFRLDPGDLVLPPADQVMLFSAADDDASGPHASHVQLWMRGTSSGGHRVQVHYMEPDRTRHRTAYHVLPKDPVDLAVDFRRATGTQYANGRIDLWIDGVLIETVEGLPSHGEEVESLFLGSIGPDVLTSGNLYIDSFAAWE